MAKKVVVDFGHYKCDSGAVYNWNGKQIREVDLVIGMGNAMVEGLKRHGFEVLVTYGSLANRVSMANKFKADLFVSIHTNAGGGDGCEVYWTGSNKNTEKLAKLCLENILEDKLNNSRGVKKSAFYVLKYTNMPACLVETGFGDNVEDRKSIDTLKERQAFGEALTEAVCEYFNVKYKGESKPTEKPTTTSKIFRVKDNGKQIGAYSREESVISEVTKLIKAKKSKIQITYS